MPELLRETIDFLGYWGIAILMIVVAPEVIMPVAGFMAGEGMFSPVALVAAGSAGAVFGLVVLYLLGRRLGEERTRRFLGRYGRWLLLTDRDFDAMIAAFRRRGATLILFGRFLPTVRSLISIPAGLVAMPFARYLLLTVAGTVTWNAVLMAAAYGFASQRGRLLVALEAYELAVVAGLVILVAVLVLRRLRARLLPAYSGEPSLEEENAGAAGSEARGARPQGSIRSKRMS